MRPLPISNPPNPWSATEVHYQAEYLEGPPPELGLVVYRDASRQIIARNDSPDVGFAYSVNPYRGCLHGCAYCYARPTHEYLGFGAGTDFDRRIVVKTEAPALLRAALAKRERTGGNQAIGRPGEALAFSGVTDCYQPIEAAYRLTRGCLQACADHRTPVGMITKSALIERDLDVLKALADGPGAHVTISLPFRDADTARAIEPLAASPERRLQTMARLAEAGIDVSVNIAPVIPGLNDADIPWILKASKQAGATGAGYVLLRLPGNVANVFQERLQERLPLRAERIMSLVRQTRDGAIYDARFGKRGRGSGPVAANIATVFHATAERWGLHHRPTDTEGARVPGETNVPVAGPRRSEQLRLL